jgi:AcrR family transcriptional regulator
MERATYHHGDLREAILVAADALVAEKGVAAFSLREAARLVGVDPAACYRHFRDKGSVVQALAQRGFTRLAAHMSDSLASVTRRSPERELLALGRAYVEFSVEHRSSFQVMFGPTGVDARDETLRGSYPEGQGPYDLLQDRLRAWSTKVECGLDIDRASVILWSGVHGVACLLVDGALRPRDAKEQSGLVDAIVLTLLRGLATAPAGQRRRGAHAGSKR